MDYYGPASFFDRGHYCILIKRPDGTQVNDLNAGSTFLLRLPGGFDSNRYHRAIGKKADIVSLLYRLCLAQRNSVIFFRGLLTERAIELDVFQEEYRIRIGNSRGQ